MQRLGSHADRKSFKHWFAQELSKFSGDKRLTETQTMFVFAVIFWVGTYCIFSIRSALFPPIDTGIISPKRLFTTYIGAMLFLGALAGMMRFSKSGKHQSYLLIIASTIAASSLLLLFRLAYNGLAEPDTFGVTDHARWILVWDGYFFGGLALFSPKTRIAALEAPALLEPASAQETDHVIWVQRNKELVKVPVDQIEWVEAQGNYIYAHAAGAGGILRGSLSSFEERLQARGFIRVHRSALCQKGHIQTLRRTSGGGLIVTLASGTELPVGRSYAPNVTAMMSH